MYNLPYSKGDIAFHFIVEEPFAWNQQLDTLDSVYDRLKLRDVSEGYRKEFSNQENRKTSLEDFFDGNEPFAKACLEKTLEESSLEIQFSETNNEKHTNYYRANYSVGKDQKNRIESFTGKIEKITIDQYYEHKLRILSEELNRRIIELENINFATSHKIRSPLARILGLIEILKIEGKYDPYLEMLEICGKELDQEIRKFTKLLEENKTPESR